MPIDAEFAPTDDLVMVVDRDNTAHALKPAPRPVFEPTLCGGRYDSLAAIHDLLDTLAAPWSLLIDPQYRAWPPWPCQTCVARSRAVLVPEDLAGIEANQGDDA